MTEREKDEQRFYDNLCVGFDEVRQIESFDDSTLYVVGFDGKEFDVTLHFDEE